MIGCFSFSVHQINEKRAASICLSCLLHETVRKRGRAGLTVSSARSRVDFPFSHSAIIPTRYKGEGFVSLPLTDLGVFPILPPVKRKLLIKEQKSHILRRKNPHDRLETASFLLAFLLILIPSVLIAGTVTVTATGEYIMGTTIPFGGKRLALQDANGCSGKDRDVY
jgi:hypothetical protein